MDAICQPIPEKISHLRTRITGVPMHGAYVVPMYIVRIDAFKRGYGAGTHGWQVRFKKPWTFFNDWYKDPINSLTDAIEYLADEWKPRPIKINTKEKRNKKIPLGIVGVRLFTRKKKNRNTQELYAEAVPMRHGEVPVRFYIGTSNTATPERTELALKIAKAQRKRFELEQFFQKTN